MKLTKPSLPGIGMLFAVVLSSIPMLAQQEVSPDHFDDNPVATSKSKPAPKQTKQVAAKKPSPVSHAAVKPKAQPASAQSSAAPVQTASNR